MVYSSEIILFLYLHFIWLYGSWNHQKILKKDSFWKCDGWFSSEVSKPSSVKYPWNHTFSGTTLIFTNIAPWYLFLSLNVVSIVFRWYFGHFFGTLTWTKDIFCLHELIFQWHNKLISHQGQFWHLRRKAAVIFSKRMFFQNSLMISWAI